MTLFNFSRIQDAWDSRGEPESVRTLVSVFWRALLGLMFFVLLFAIWFGSQELEAASQADNPGTASSSGKPPWTPEQLQSTLDFFSQRQVAYEALSESPLPSITDPSK